MEETYNFCSVCGSGLIVGAEVCPRCQARARSPAQPIYDEKIYGRQEVVVTDFNMSFSSMIIFMIKWAIAAIPAMIILFFLVAMLLAVLGGLRGSN